MKLFLKVKLTQALRIEGFGVESLDELNKIVDYIMEMYFDKAIAVEEGVHKAIELAIDDYIDQDLFRPEEIERLYVI